MYFCHRIPSLFFRKGYLISSLDGLNNEDKTIMDYTKQEFEHLFKDNYPLMYRMAFSMVENADDAKDAVHQVFTQMWQTKPR